LAQQAFAGSQAAAMRLRVESNEMQGLSSTALLVLGDDIPQTGHTSSLMVSGNRMESSIPLRESLSVLESILFASVAAIVLTTCCVVAGNMILNTGDLEKERISLILLDPNSAPTPEIMVSANVFQGRTVIEPARYPASSNVPPPMNSWNFLNTVIF
jgi:hypothetical protein